MKNSNVKGKMRKNKIRMKRLILWNKKSSKF